MTVIDVTKKDLDVLSWMLDPKAPPKRSLTEHQARGLVRLGFIESTGETSRGRRYYRVTDAGRSVGQP